LRASLICVCKTHLTQIASVVIRTSLRKHRAPFLTHWRTLIRTAYRREVSEETLALALS
jgi:hypothetical protein